MTSTPVPFSQLLWGGCHLSALNRLLAMIQPGPLFTGLLLEWPGERGDNVSPHLRIQAPWPLWNSMLARFISRTDPSLCICVGRRMSLVTWGHFHDCVAIRISWIRG